MVEYIIAVDKDDKEIGSIEKMGCTISYVKKKCIYF